jgi:subtilase family serine protease
MHADADSAGQVAESDEANNTASGIFACGPG